MNTKKPRNSCRIFIRANIAYYNRYIIILYGLIRVIICYSKSLKLSNTDGSDQSLLPFQSACVFGLQNQAKIIDWLPTEWLLWGFRVFCVNICVYNSNQLRRKKVTKLTRRHICWRTCVERKACFFRKTTVSAGKNQLWRGPLSNHEPICCANFLNLFV